jgi:hypothetical protein
VQFRIGTRQSDGTFRYSNWATRNPAAATYTVTIDWNAANQGAAQLHVNGGQVLASRTGSTAARVGVVQVGSIWSDSNATTGTFAFDAVTLA